MTVAVLLRPGGLSQDSTQGTNTLCTPALPYTHCKTHCIPLLSHRFSGSSCMIIAIAIRLHCLHKTGPHRHRRCSRYQLPSTIE